VTALDLIREFDRAEKRPAADFDVSTFEIGGVARPAIVAPVPSRLVWPLPLPRRGVLRTFVAAGYAAGEARAPIRLRVGISDHRIYEGLGQVMLTHADRGWTELRADLSAYAGWKWSLFYRPERISWRIVLSADATGGAPARALWGSPEVLTDSQSARQYSTRRR